MSTIQVSLPDELQAWVEREARGRGYADAGEFVGVLLHQAKAQTKEPAPEEDEFLGGRTEAELAALINEGLASERIALTVDMWAEMLGDVDEKARQKGIKSNLRESFLSEVPAVAAR